MRVIINFKYCIVSSIILLSFSLADIWWMAAKVKKRNKIYSITFWRKAVVIFKKNVYCISQGRQFIVYTEVQILNECIKANFIDCRLNAYSVLLDDDLG